MTGAVVNGPKGGLTKIDNTDWTDAQLCVCTRFAPSGYAKQPWVLLVPHGSIRLSLSAGARTNALICALSRKVRTQKPASKRGCRSCAKTRRQSVGGGSGWGPWWRLRGPNRLSLVRRMDPPAARRANVDGRSRSRRARLQGRDMRVVRSRSRPSNCQRLPVLRLCYRLSAARNSNCTSRLSVEGARTSGQRRRWG